MADEQPQGTEVAPPTDAEIAEYRAFQQQVGVTPRQAAALIDDYLKLKETVDKPAVKAAPEKDEKDEKPAPKNDKDEKIREDLFGLVPELKNLSLVETKVKELEAQLGEAAKDKFIEANLKADQLIESWLAKELNVDLDTPEGKEYAEIVSHRVGNAIFGNQSRLDKLATGKATVATEVLKEMQKAGQFKFDKIPTKVTRATALPFVGRGNNPPAAAKAALQKELAGLSPSERFQRIAGQTYDQVMVRE